MDVLLKLTLCTCKQMIQTKAAYRNIVSAAACISTSTKISSFYDLSISCFSINLNAVCCKEKSSPTAHAKCEKFSQSQD